MAVGSNWKLSLDVEGDHYDDTVEGGNDQGCNACQSEPAAEERSARSKNEYRERKHQVELHLDGYAPAEDKAAHVQSDVADQ